MNLDNMSDRGNALVMADTIKQYWAKQGYDVNVWLEERLWFDQEARRRVDFDIRSDLLNGKPQRKRRFKVY